MIKCLPVIKIHIGKIPGQLVHQGRAKGVTDHGNAPAVRRPWRGHVEDVLIPQHILHMDGQIVAKACDDRILITAVLFRQMEQVHQITWRSRLIGHGYILYGHCISPQCLYDHLGTHISPCKVPVGIRLIVPCIIPVGVKILPGVQHRDTGMFPKIFLQLGRTVPVPDPLIAVRHIFPVNAFLVGRDHHQEGNPPALIIAGGPDDLIADHGHVILIKRLCAKGVKQAHPACKKVPALFPPYDVLGIRITEQLQVKHGVNAQETVPERGMVIDIAVHFRRICLKVFCLKDREFSQAPVLRTAAVPISFYQREQKVREKQDSPEAPNHYFLYHKCTPLYVSESCIRT